MGRRATITEADLVRAANVAIATGVRVTLRRGDAVAVVDPPGAPVASAAETADSALEAWLGGRDERPA